MSDPTAARLRNLFKDLRALGIDKGKAAWPVLTRAEVLAHHATVARTSADTAWNRAVAELVKTGDITDAARADLAVYAAANATDRGGERIIDRAVRSGYAVLIREAENVARPEVPAVFAALSRVADAAVKAVEKAGVPAGVHDEASLFQAGINAQDWETVKAAVDRFDTAHSAYTTLRDLGWLPEYRIAWHRYAHADLAHPVARARTVPTSAAFTLAYAITAGAKPGMFDADAARNNHAQSSNLKGAKR